MSALSNVTSEADLIQILTDSLNRVVAGREDYVYVYDRESDGTKCLYLLPNGEPSCLWGHVAIDLGIDRVLIESSEGGSAVGLIERALPISISTRSMRDVKKAITKSQVVQDGTPHDQRSRGTWGHARDAFMFVLAQRAQ